MMDWGDEFENDQSVFRIHQNKIITIVPTLWVTRKWTGKKTYTYGPCLELPDNYETPQELYQEQRIFEKRSAWWGLNE